MTDVRDDAPSLATPPTSAAEKPRWLKAYTMRFEVAHQNRIGGTLRDAEDANNASLQRLDAKKREDRGRRVLTPDRVALEERRARRRDKLGVQVKPIAPVYVAAAKACRNCGRCRLCAREARTVAIMAKAREGDAAMAYLTHNLVALTLAHQKRIDCRIAPTPGAPGKEVGFARMMLHGERNLAFVGAVEAICDWSVGSLGKWRP